MFACSPLEFPVQYSERTRCDHYTKWEQWPGHSIIDRGRCILDQDTSYLPVVVDHHVVYFIDVSSTERIDRSADALILELHPSESLSSRHWSPFIESFSNHEELSDPSLFLISTDKPRDFRIHQWRTIRFGFSIFFQWVPTISKRRGSIDTRNAFDETMVWSSFSPMLSSTNQRIIFEIFHSMKYPDRSTRLINNHEVQFWSLLSEIFVLLYSISPHGWSIHLVMYEMVLSSV